MLKMLDFNLAQPSPIDFLRRFSKIASADQRTHIIAKFCIETALYSAELVRVKPSLKAAAALFIALKIRQQSMEGETWTPELVHYSQLQETDLYPTVKIIVEWLIKTVTDIMQK